MTEHFASNLSKERQETLRHLSNLLHLFHHRNKNQHRRSTWWRHFSTFRKQLASLIEDIEKLHEVPKSHLAQAKKKTQDPETRLRIMQRCTLWRSVMVPKWHHTFSQVVADGRFAVLGLVLSAVLAQVCEIVHITSDLDGPRQLKAEEALQAFGRDRLAVPKAIGDLEDTGEVVARSSLEDGKGHVAFTDQQSKSPSVQMKDAEPEPVEISARQLRTSQNQSTKKRRKRGNAIDDLFSGLE